MITVHAQNVNQAFPTALWMLQQTGVRAPSRNGDVIAFPEPVSTRYTKPWQRVLFSPLRNCNPFFHFMESMWMLAGQNDVEFLAQYNKSIAQFSDDGTTFHGAYGKRWWMFSQLPNVIETLRKDPTSRRAVLAMHDMDIEAGYAGKDQPCNTHVYFDCRDGALNMTVCNRSNDLFWGCYGANVVHFSFLQQFVAEALGSPVGWYEQVSNNLHVYTDKYPKEKWNDYIVDANNSDAYNDSRESMLFEARKHAYGGHDIHGLGVRAMMRDCTQRQLIDDLRRFCESAWKPHPESSYTTHWLNCVVLPMQLAWQFRKNRQLALAWCGHIQQPDWSLACANYLLMKEEKKNARKSIATA